MALDDTIDPFGTPDIAVNPNPDSSTFSTLSNQWNGFLAEPKNRAALMSFGLQLMQPVGLGQSGIGQVGQAIGQAGEGLRTAEKLDIAESDAERKARDAEDRARARDVQTGQREQALTLSGMRFNLSKDIQTQKLGIQQQLADVRTQRASAKSDFEAQTLDRQERNLQRQLDQLELNRSDVRRTGEVTDRQQEGELATAARAATNGIVKQLAPNPFGLTTTVPDHLKPYQNMTPDEVYGKVYGDMATAAKARKAPQPGATAAPVPQNDPTMSTGEGLTATDAQGNKIVRRNGKWVPLTQ